MKFMPYKSFLTTLVALIVLIVLVSQSALSLAETAVAPNQAGEVPIAKDAAKDATPSNEQLHQQLRALKTTMEKALNEMDIDTVTAHVTEDVVFTTMNGDLVRGRAGVREYFEKMMKGEKRRVERITAKFEVGDLSNLYASDTAVAFGTSNDRYVLAGGSSFDVQARWSSTMIRRNGQWLIANFHYSTNIFDNPVLDAQRKFAILAGSGVALVLALAGFFFGRARGRKLTGK
jgi:uncharacterized protein (TIGR02246 family)